MVLRTTGGELAHRPENRGATETRWPGMRPKRGVEVSASHEHGFPAAAQPVAADVMREDRAPHAEGTNVVEVRVPAEADQLAVVRAVVGDLAMRADFDVDSIADIRLAVDEACSSLVRLAAKAATLVCRFHSDSAEITVVVEVGSDERSEPRKDTFSWRVLSALADSVSTSVEAGGDSAGSNLVRIELTKGRMAHE